MTMKKRYMSPGEKEYLDSGSWKCAESPTGAHFWDCNLKPSVCTICGKVNKPVAAAIKTKPV